MTEVESKIFYAFKEFKKSYYEDRKKDFLFIFLRQILKYLKLYLWLNKQKKKIVH